MPFTEGKTLKGWGVVREAPWHFAGIFQSRKDAEARAAQLGANYVVRLGEQQEGTDNFVWSASENPHA
jgi:hypothetical protein